MAAAIDHELREAVYRQFGREFEILAQDIQGINVDVADGTVSLTGRVCSYAKKVAAGGAAKFVYGVKAVVNDLIVAPMEDIDHDMGASGRLDGTNGNVGPRPRP